MRTWTRSVHEAMDAWLGEGGEGGERWHPHCADKHPEPSHSPSSLAPLIPSFRQSCPNLMMRFIPAHTHTVALHQSQLRRTSQADSSSVSLLGAISY